jgi:hypothetical protein
VPTRRFRVLSPVLFLVLVGCGKTPPTEATPQEVQRAPGPSLQDQKAYRVLARQLADHSSHDRKKPEPCQDSAQIVAAAQASLLDLNALRPDDPDLRLIRDEASAATRDAISAIQTLERLPLPPSSGDLFLTGLLCGVSLRFDLAAQVGVDAQAKTDAALAEVRKLSASWQRITAAKLLLKRAAPKYSSAALLDSPIRVDIDAGLVFVGLDDWAAFKNTTGRTLHDALVVVRLKGVDGETKENVHFVSEWQAGQTIHAAYPNGLKVSGMQIGRQTVTSIQTAHVSVFSVEGRVKEFEYTYNGKEKDADITAYMNVVRDHVGIGWREGATSGVVFQFTNKSNLTIQSVSFKTSAGSYNYGTLRPGETAEVGWQQVDRNLRSGDRVEVFFSGVLFAQTQY